MHFTHELGNLFIMAEFMKRALKLANDALIAQEVPVGCVFTVNRNIVAESQNSVNISHNPTRHAEMNCIDIIIQHCEKNKLNVNDFFRDIVVYVTVEPCIMCAAALGRLKVKEVIYGCANDRFGGSTVLNVHDFYPDNYTLTGNLLADDAMALLKNFYKGTNPNAPKTKAKVKLLK